MQHTLLQACPPTQQAFVIACSLADVATDPEMESQEGTPSNGGVFMPYTQEQVEKA